MKKISIIGLTLLCGLGLTGCGDSTETATETSKSKTEETSAKEETSTTKEKEEKKEESKKEENTFGIGDVVSAGDMEYTVNSIETAKELGPTVLPADAKGAFLIVDMTVKNNGYEAVTVDRSFFKLKAGEKTFEVDSIASLSANQDENGEIINSFFMQQLDPDMEQNGKIVFDVSEAQATSTKNILQAQTDDSGTETVSIDLK